MGIVNLTPPNWFAVKEIGKKGQFVRADQVIFNEYGGLVLYFRLISSKYIPSDRLEHIDILTPKIMERRAYKALAPFYDKFDSGELEKAVEEFVNRAKIPVIVVNEDRFWETFKL